MTDPTPPPDDDFVERVMGGVARSERRLPLVVAALAVSLLVLAVPGVVALVARPALDAGLALMGAALREVAGAVVDNPFFWVGVAVTAGWLVWVATRAVGRGPA
ncbi:MAG: hypothetical protein AB7O78_03715 [Thermoleophilia bacterium]